MIVRRLHLHPFAGSSDREVTFSSGLNVVVGPNEAGKTTLRRALRQVLFVPTKLTKTQAKEKVTPYLPLSGGDTIRVSVELEAEGKTWKLSKRWASGNSSAELQLPGGGIVSENEAIETSVAALRGLTQGTWENVLFATQGGVGDSLTRLGDGVEFEDLNQVMRRAVFETDGVSLEILAEAIEERWEKAFGRWDRELNRPEGNRGLDNAWARGAGSIVTSWYGRERARLALSAAETYYRRLDELNTALSAAVRENESLKNWVESHEAVARDTELRSGLEGRLAQVQAKGTGLKQISHEWPVAASKRLDQETLAASLRGKSAALAVELTAARAWEAAAKLRSLLESAEQMQSRLELSRKERDALFEVTAKDIETLETNGREQDRLRARLEAAVLKVSFRAGKTINLETRSGVGEPLPASLPAGEELHFSAGGRAVIREAGGEWELEVSSGEIDVTAEEVRFQKLETDSAALLVRMRAVDLTEARKKRNDYQEKSNHFRMLEKQLSELLGPERTLDSLRRELAETGASASAPVRGVEDLSKALGKADAEAIAAEKESAALRTRIASWVESYQSADALLDLLVDLRGEHQTIRRDLDALRPLPEPFTEAAPFLEEFRRQKNVLETKKAAMNQILIEKAGLEGQAPELEPADAADQLLLASAAFDRSLREGEAVGKIREQFCSLRIEMDQGTLDPWLRHFAEVMSPLTGEKYRAISLGDSLVFRSDEIQVPFGSLSAGTFACLGLAVRLSMARWFLEGRDGFLILDDPLVDLDPARQVAATAMLKRFAEDKQVILLTCHPGHADLLGGNRIEL